MAEVSHGCLYSAEVLDSFGDLVAALNKGESILPKGESIPPKHLITGDFGNTIKRHACGTYHWLPHTNNQKEQPWCKSNQLLLCIHCVFTLLSLHTQYQDHFLLAYLEDRGCITTYLYFLISKCSNSYDKVMRPEITIVNGCGYGFDLNLTSIIFKALADWYNAFNKQLDKK